METTSIPTPISPTSVSAPTTLPPQVPENQIVQDNVEPQEPQQHSQEVAINKIPVTDQNIALQLLVAFVQLGHRRGAYNIEETAKIHECIEMFKTQQQPTEK